MKKQSAFTMIEIMIGLVVFGTILAFMVPRMTKYLTGTKEKLTKSAMLGIKADLEQYMAENGKYPTTAEGLNTVIHDERELRDSWGTEYEYNSPPTEYKDRGYKNYEIISYGPDKEPSGDDIIDGS